MRAIFRATLRAVEPRGGGAPAATHVSVQGIFAPPFDASTEDGGTALWHTCGIEITEALDQGQTRLGHAVFGLADQEEAEGAAVRSRTEGPAHGQLGQDPPATETGTWTIYPRNTALSVQIFSRV